MKCTKCGTENPDGVKTCSSCGESLQDFGDRLVEARHGPRKSINLIIAKYSTLLCWTGIAIPFALIFGILSLIEIKRDPGRKSLGWAIAATTVGAIGMYALFDMVVLQN